MLQTIQNIGAKEMSIYHVCHECIIIISSLRLYYYMVLYNTLFFVIYNQTLTLWFVDDGFTHRTMTEDALLY